MTRLGEVDHGDVDIDDVVGGGGNTCDWQEDTCVDTPTHYLVAFCDNPDCPDRHTERYCARHYVIALTSHLDHLAECPSMVEADGADAVAQRTREHIAAWGEISS